MTELEFCKHLKVLSDAAGGQNKLAQRLGVGQCYLSDVIRGNKHPGPSIYGALGFQRVVTYALAPLKESGK